jgi:hypothetical protein
MRLAIDPRQAFGHNGFGSWWISLEFTENALGCGVRRNTKQGQAVSNIWSSLAASAQNARMPSDNFSVAMAS